MVRFLDGPNGELFKVMAALSTAAKNKELMLAEEVEKLIDSDEDN